jgi:hypothetical protein
MGTSLNEVYDVFMMTVTDYRLIDLFNESQEDFENYLQAWLRYAINDFKKTCDQSLIFDYTTKSFSVDLSEENKIALATLMMKWWLQKEVNNVTQFNLHITDRDFKMASEAANLKEKTNYLNVVKEQCSQMLIDYGYEKNAWSDWFNQEYEGV